MNEYPSLRCLLTRCHAGQTSGWELNSSFLKINDRGCLLYPWSLQNTDHLGYLHQGILLTTLLLQFVFSLHILSLQPDWKKSQTNHLLSSRQRLVPTQSPFFLNFSLVKGFCSLLYLSHTRSQKGRFQLQMSH